MSGERLHLGAGEGRSRGYMEQLGERHPLSCHKITLGTGAISGFLLAFGLLFGHALTPLFAVLFVGWLALAGTALLVVDPLLSIRVRWPSAVHRAGASEYNGRAPRIRLLSLLANVRQGLRPGEIDFEVERDSASADDLNQAGPGIARRLGWDRCEVEDLGDGLRVHLSRVPGMETRGPQWDR